MMFERVPLHLFDYSTLARLSTTNKYWHSQCFESTKFLDKAYEIYKYLKTCSKEKHAAIVFCNSLTRNDVWRIFEFVLKEFTSHSVTPNNRYVYVPRPNSQVALNVYSQSLHTQGIQNELQLVTYIDSLPVLTRRGVVASSLNIVMAILWGHLELMAKDCCGPNVIFQVTNWRSSNVSLCKLDRVKRRIYASEAFSQSSNDLLANVPSYFIHNCNSNTYIRHILVSLL